MRVCLSPSPRSEFIRVPGADGKPTGSSQRRPADGHGLATAPETVLRFLFQLSFCQVMGASGAIQIARKWGPK
jgi:hypothetical protein